jgi:hypothetical protein
LSTSGKKILTNQGPVFVNKDFDIREAGELSYSKI